MCFRRILTPSIVSVALSLRSRVVAVSNFPDGAARTFLGYHAAAPIAHDVKDLGLEYMT